MLLCPPSTQTSPTRMLSRVSGLALARDGHLLRARCSRARRAASTFHARSSPAVAVCLLAGERDRDLLARRRPSPRRGSACRAGAPCSDWKRLLTHSPSPIAGTSTTSSRGIGWASAGSVNDPARVMVAIKRYRQSPGFITRLLRNNKVELRDPSYHKVKPRDVSTSYAGLVSGRFLLGPSKQARASQDKRKLAANARRRGPRAFWQRESAVL